MSVFETLNKINVNEHTEKKGRLTYLSWAWAWQVTKENFPDAQYTIYENQNGWNYFTDGKTCWVKTGVTINGLEHIEYLPVMDYKNQSIPYDSVTSMAVNTAIQRSLTKAIARHGLGLYIYAGEDLPNAEAEEEKQAIENAKKTPIDYPKIAVLKKELERTGVTESKLFNTVGVKSFEEMTIDNFTRAMELFKNTPSKG